MFLQNFHRNLNLLVGLKAWKPGFISVLLYSTDSSRGSKISVGSDSQYNPTSLIFTGITKWGLYLGQEGQCKWGSSLSLDSVGAALLVCLPGRATEYWTSPAVLILQISSRIFVSYIKTAKYLPKKCKSYIFYTLYEISICILRFIHFRTIILIAGINYQ